MSSISITVDGVARIIEADQRPTHIFSEAKEIVVCKVNGVLKDLWTELAEGDVVEGIARFGNASVDAVLHDPPRFGIAGELYSLDFYEQLARVLKKKGRLFHYTGTPNKLTSGRDVPAEVAKRLQRAGFTTSFNGDGVLAVRK